MNKQKNFKIQALILSLFIISLDAYSLFSIPLQWLGLSFLSLFLLINLKFIETRFNSILYIFGTLLFLPILFEIISDNSLLGNLSYQLRIFNFVTFVMAFYASLTIFENINKEAFVNYLEKFLVLISLLAIYIFFSQIFDLYEPTLKCLQLLKPRFVKGTILAFDELNDKDSPGETLALMKSIGLNKVKLERYKFASRISYFVFD